MMDMPEKKEKKASKKITSLSLALILVVVVLGLAAGSWFYLKSRNDHRESNIAIAAMEQHFKSLEQEIASLNQALEQAKTIDQEQLAQIKEQIKVPANIALLCADVNLLLAKEAFAKANIEAAKDLVNAAFSCSMESFPELDALKTGLNTATPLAWDVVVQDLWALNDDVPLLDASKAELKPEQQLESGWRRFWSDFKTEVAKLFVVEDDALLEARARLQLYLSSAAIFAQTHDVEKTIALLEASNALLVERFDMHDKKVKNFLEKSEALKNSLGSPILHLFDQAITAIQNKLKEQRP